MSVARFVVAATYTGTITQASGAGNTIDVGWNNGFSLAGGTFVGGNANITTLSGLILTGGTFTSTSATLNVSSGDFSMSGGTFNGNGGSLQVSANNLSITGGTFNHGGNTLSFTGTGASQEMTTGGATFNNMVVNLTNSNGNKDNLTISGNLILAGNLTVTDGELRLDTSNPDVSVAGNVSIAAAGQVTKGTGTWTFSGTGSYTDSTAAVQDLGTVVVGGTTATRTLLSAMKATALTIDSGDVLWLNGYAFSFTAAAAVTNNGTFRLQGGETLTNVNNLGTAAGTVEYVGDGDGAADTYTLKDFGATDYYNLKIGATDAAAPNVDTFSSAAAKAVAGTLTVTAGILNANGQTTTVTGLATVSGGTYQASTAAQTLSGGLTVGGGTFTGSTGTVDATDVTISSGTLTAPSNTFTVSGNWTKSGGTFTPGTNRVTFSKASGTQTLNSGGAGFYQMTHSGAGTLQLTGSTLTVTNNLQNNAGVFDLNGQNWTMTGASFANPGTVQLRGSETITGLTQDATQGTFKYVGDADGAADTFTVADFSAGGSDYYNLTISATDGTAPNVDTFSFAAGKALAGALTVTAGVLTANGQTTTVTGLATVSGGTYQAGTATQTLNGGLTVSGGTFTGSTGTVDATNVALSSGTLTAPSGTFTVSGNWSKTGGTFDAGTYAVTFDAADTGHSLSGTMTGAGSRFYDLAFTGSGGGWTVSAAVEVSNDLTVAAGTLQGTQNVTVSGGDATGNGTISLTGGTFLLDGAGNFGGNSGWTFYDLTLGDGAGATTTAATGSGDVTVTHALSIAANQTLDASSKVWVLSGTGTPLAISGAFTANASTFRYTGNGATNVAATTYQHLEIKPSGNATHTLGTAAAQTITVNGDLTVGNGTNTATVQWATWDPTLNVLGNMTLVSPSVWTKSDLPATLYLKANGTKTLIDNNAIKQDLGVLSISGGSSTPKIQLASDITAQSVAVGDALDVNGARTLILTGTGTPFSVTGTFTYSTGTVRYTGNGATNIAALSGTGGTNGYYNLEIKPAGNATHTLGTAAAQTIAVNGDLTVGNGTNTATVQWATWDPTLNVLGSMTLASPSVWTRSDLPATLYLKANGTKTLIDNNAIKQDLGVLSISGGSNTPNIQLGSDVAAQSVAVADWLDANGARALTLTGTGTPFAVTGTFTYSTGTVRYTGGGATNIAALSGTGGTNGYYNLEVKPGANSATHTFAAGTVSVNGAFAAGNGTNTGVTVTAATNATTLTVTGDATISANTTLVTNATATTTVGGTTSGAGTLQISTGIFDANGAYNVSGATTFTDAGRLQLGGTVTSLGTFTASSGTVEYDSRTADQTVAAVTYNNLEVDNFTRVATAGGNFAVGGNLSVVSGAFDVAARTVTVTGSVVAGWRLDLGSTTTPVATGYTRFPVQAYSAGRGCGWDNVSGIDWRDRGAGASDLQRDFHFAPSDHNFLVDLPNGNYTVKVYFGDLTYGHDNIDVSVEGTLVLDDYSTIAGQFTSQSFAVTVADGQLTLGLHEDGGSDPNWVVDGIDVTGTGEIRIGAGTLDANGAYDMTGGATTFTGAGRLELGGTVTSLGTFTASTGTVEYNNTAAGQTVANVNYHNLEADNGGQTATIGFALAPTNVGGTLTVTGASVVDLNAGLDLTGRALTFAGAGELRVAGNIADLGSFTKGSGKVTLDGGVAQSIASAVAPAFHDLTITNNSTATLNTDATVDATTLDVDAGSSLAVASAKTLTLLGGVTLDGTLELKAGATLATGGNITGLSTSTFKASGTSMAPGEIAVISNNGSGNYSMTLDGNVVVSNAEISDLADAGLTLSGSGTTTFDHVVFTDGQSSSIVYLHVTDATWNSHTFSGVGFEDMGVGTSTIEITTGGNVTVTDYASGTGWASGDASDVETSGTVTWAPTAADGLSAAAKTTGQGTLVVWTAPVERGTLGYRVLRREASAGENTEPGSWRRLAEVPAETFGGEPTGNEYRWLDESTGRSATNGAAARYEYRVEEIEAGSERPRTARADLRNGQQD